MKDKALRVCNGCRADLLAAGYAVELFPAMLPTIGTCDVCKRRRPIFQAVVGKPRLDRPCGKMLQSPAVTVLQHENTM